MKQNIRQAGIRWNPTVSENDIDSNTRARLEREGALHAAMEAAREAFHKTLPNTSERSAARAVLQEAEILYYDSL